MKPVPLSALPKKYHAQVVAQLHPSLAPGGPIPHPKPERHKAPALGGTVQGKAQGDGRVTVRFTGYRVRPLDPDNFAGSVKDLLDGLRHAGILLGDEPWRIRIETEQERVGSYAQERTEITVVAQERAGR